MISLRTISISLGSNVLSFSGISSLPGSGALMRTSRGRKRRKRAVVSSRKMAVYHLFATEQRFVVEQMKHAITSGSSSTVARSTAPSPKEENNKDKAPTHLASGCFSSSLRLNGGTNGLLTPSVRPGLDRPDTARGAVM